MEWLLEIVLVVMLAMTLFHALRLERALGVLRRDRAALEELVSGFNSSTRAAEQGIERLRDAADGAGRQIARQTETARALKEDLQFLSDRGERLADRLEQLVRGSRASPSQPPAAAAYEAAEDLEANPAPIPQMPQDHTRVRSQAERDLLKALRLAR